MKKSLVWSTEQGDSFRIDNDTTIEKDEYRLSVYDYIVLHYIQKSTHIE